MKNLFQNRAVGFWLDLAGTVLTLVGIILYALYAADTGSNNVWVYIGLVAAVAAGAAGLVTDNDLLAIAAPALSAVSLCAFITDSVYTFVGYFFGLAMFGDVSKIGAIMRICVVVAISMLALLISSFMRKDTGTKSSNASRMPIPASLSICRSARRLVTSSARKSWQVMCPTSSR